MSDKDWSGSRKRWSDNDNAQYRIWERDQKKKSKPASSSGANQPKELDNAAMRRKLDRAQDLKLEAYNRQGMRAAEYEQQMGQLESKFEQQRMLAADADARMRRNQLIGNMFAADCERTMLNSIRDHCAQKDAEVEKAIARKDSEVQQALAQKDAHLAEELQKAEKYYKEQHAAVVQRNQALQNELQVS